VIGRSASLLAVVVIFAYVTVLPTESHGGNCQDKLANNSYDCLDKVVPAGGVAKFCLEFVTGGVSKYFDAIQPPSSTHLGCACLTTGSFKVPSFDASSSGVECVSDDGVQLHGKVASDKLTLQISYEDGQQHISSCTKRSTASCLP
jgi:hypothetical protein